MRYRCLVLGLVVGLLAASCRDAQQRSPRLQLTVHTYLQLLERLELAGNRYRRATDLQERSGSSLEEGSLVASHLQLTRQFLESEFQLADIEAKNLALSEAAPAESGAAPTAAEQAQYEKIAGEVWRLSAEVDAAKERLSAARQSLKKALTADAFRKAQDRVDQLQKEADIADKKLDLAGSNLDIQDYKRKRATVGASDALSFADRLKMMKDELFPAKSPTSSGPVQRDTQRTTAAEPSQAGIVASVQEYFARRQKSQSLQRALQEAGGLLNQIKESLEGRQRQLETLQAQHLEVNRKTELSYSEAYELLRKGGQAPAVARILEDADRRMAESGRLEQQKELASRALTVVGRQASLVQDDREKLASWSRLAAQESNDSLLRAGSRIGIVLAMVLAILVLSHYLKKLPYKFTHEGKNLYYFRKLISFTSGLLIAAIVVLNFISDFGGLSAVVGLAGAGLAIALQDPIVSLVGWFLIVGRFGISVGDRVEINQVKGDVIDIGLLRIAVLEVGNWVGAEQSTGRVVFFPNSFIFKSHYFNYSTANSFIWDEIRFTVTYESDWKRAREILEEVATRASQSFIEAARNSQAQLERQFHINLGTLTPYVYVSIASNGVDLVLRYLTEIRQRRSTQDKICQEVLEAMSHAPGIELSAPARRAAAETKTAPTATPASGS